jgi:hypothetical protein
LKLSNTDQSEPVALRSFLAAAATDFVHTRSRNRQGSGRRGVFPGARKLGGDRHCPAVKVEHVVGQVEPEQLTRPHLTGDQVERHDQP